MRSFADIRDYLRHTWRDSDLIRACEAIIAHIEQTQLEHLQLLTYRNLQQIADRKQVDETLLNAVNILTTSQIEMLEPHLLFESEDGKEFDLSSEVVKDFLKTGQIVHPQSGEVVQDAGRYVIPYFSASPEVTALKERSGD